MCEHALYLSIHVLSKVSIVLKHVHIIAYLRLFDDVLRGLKCARDLRIA